MFWFSKSSSVEEIFFMLKANECREVMVILFIIVSIVCFVFSIEGFVTTV